VEHGVHVAAGVLHGSDTDLEVAERLDIEHVSVPAFSEIDEAAAAAWRGHVAAADVIVLCDPPIGPGNVRNLELVLEAVAAGTPVVALDAVPIAERDFTGGAATALRERLRPSATVVRTTDDAVDAVLRFAPAGPSR
jgi:iron complex transport system ATP-binding protein